MNYFLLSLYHFTHVLLEMSLYYLFIQFGKIIHKIVCFVFLIKQGSWRILQPQSPHCLYPTQIWKIKWVYCSSFKKVNSIVHIPALFPLFLTVYWTVKGLVARDWPAFFAHRMTKSVGWWRGSCSRHVLHVLHALRLRNNW